jgi:hypothetical protein
VLLHFAILKEPVAEEELAATSNSDEEDNYGVDALELLLQKLKPKTTHVEEETSCSPAPTLNWKIELPKQHVHRSPPETVDILF